MVEEEEEAPNRRPIAPGEKDLGLEARLRGGAVGTSPGVVVADRDYLAWVVGVEEAIDLDNAEAAAAEGGQRHSTS